MKRRAAHLRLAAAYRTAVADAIDLDDAAGQVRRRHGRRALARRGRPPLRPGYSIFADAVWAAFDGAVREGESAAPDKMLNAPTYMTIVRRTSCRSGRCRRAGVPVPRRRRRLLRPSDVPLA